LRHRARLNHFEVIVPFRVFRGSEVVSSSGYSLPVRPWCPRRLPDPAGIPSSARVQGSDSLNCPLLRFDPPLRFVPKPCPGLSAEGDSHGVCFPFNAYRQLESTSFRLTGRLPDDAPKTAASCPPTGPNPPATVPLSGFLNLSATFLLLLPSYHFQIGGVHGVASYRGLFLSRSPSGSSPLAYPLDVAPNRLRCLSPRLRLRQARGP
jgi:hypothetical protein